MINNLEYLIALDTALGNYSEYRKILKNEIVREESEIFKLRNYQNKIIASATKKPTGIYSCELPTGSGKSLIGASIIKTFIGNKKAIFFCPSITALNNGIRNTFISILPKKRIGSANSTDIDNNIYLLTPQTFLNLRKSSHLYKYIVKYTNIVIVDESHHFSNNKDLKYYNQFCKIIKNLSKTKKIVALTATHYRTDGTFPLEIKRDKINDIITVQQLVNMGYCPEVYSLPVFIKVDCKGHKKVKGDYIYKFTSNQKEKYWEMIAETIKKVYETNSNIFAGFVNRVAYAHLLKEKLKTVGLKVEVLHGGTKIRDREVIIKKLQSGELDGYLTCEVGSESIDIPNLGVVHLIGRTTSLGKVIQSIGRSLRLFKGKTHSLIVDYIDMKPNIMKHCIGLSEISKKLGATHSIKLGGPLVVNFQNQQQSVNLKGIELGETEKLIINSNKVKSKKVNDSKIITYESLNITEKVNEILRKNNLDEMEPPANFNKIISNDTIEMLKKEGYRNDLFESSTKLNKTLKKYGFKRNLLWVLPDQN